MDNGEYLRSAEMAEEANYNMIDGLMNNVRKVKDKDKPRESVLAKLRLNQKKVAKQGKKQTQQKAMTEDMERKKKQYLTEVVLLHMWQGHFCVEKELLMIIIRDEYLSIVEKGEKFYTIVYNDNNWLFPNQPLKTHDISYDDIQYLLNITLKIVL